MISGIFSLRYPSVSSLFRYTVTFALTSLRETPAPFLKVRFLVYSGDLTHSPDQHPGRTPSLQTPLSTSHLPRNETFLILLLYTPTYRTAPSLHCTFFDFLPLPLTLSLTPTSSPRTPTSPPPGRASTLKNTVVICVYLPLSHSSGLDTDYS